MARVGGGGYAENRGGLGDRTGGGASRNARDGLGGSGKGGDHNFAADRARMRAAGATTITPKYGWDQAQISDFGITGGLLNMGRGILAGNTYDGRTPQGLVGGYANDPAQRAMQAMFMGQQPGQSPTARSGLYGGAGGVNSPYGQQMFMPRSKPAAPPVAQPKTPQMGYAPGSSIGTGGKYGISQFRPGYDFMKGGL